MEYTEFKAYAYVLATTGGGYPTQPRRSEPPAEHLETCKKYKPDAKWRLFRIGQDVTKEKGRIVARGNVRVEGFDFGDPIAEKLLHEIRQRHGGKIINDLKPVDIREMLKKMLKK